MRSYVQIPKQELPSPAIPHRKNKNVKQDPIVSNDYFLFFVINSGFTVGSSRGIGEESESIHSGKEAGTC